MPIEAWLDDDGMPVLIRSEVTDFRLELEVLEWGVAVEVEAPPAQQVTDP